jgi:hypothetical protein
MPRPILVLLASCFLSAPSAWGQAAAPHLVSPVLGGQFSPFESVNHSWDPAPEAVQYLVSFASSIAGQFESCLWDAERAIMDTCATFSHEQVHSPLHWRVRAVCAAGDTSNASIGYYFVGAPAVPAPIILAPWGTVEQRDVAIWHSWQEVPGAVSYEVQFANSAPHAANLFDDCDWDTIRTITATSALFDHQSTHCPVYWRIGRWMVKVSGVPGVVRTTMWIHVRRALAPFSWSLRTGVA